MANSPQAQAAHGTDLFLGCTSNVVAAVSPAGFLPATTVDPLLAGLNQDRDFYGFAVEMREAFRKQIKEERAKRG